MSSAGACLARIFRFSLRNKMHKAILALLEREPRHSLARFASGKDEGIRIVVGFGEGVNYPLWIGKTSCTKSGMERLCKERNALAYLQPWSKQFRIPALHHWDEAAGEVCLIQSGAPGFPEM